MKIVHVTAYYTTVWKYQEMYLTEEEVKQGHDVYIITSNRNFPHPNYETSAKALGPRMKEVKTVKENSYTIFYLPVYFEVMARVYLKGLMKHLLSINPDLVICHGITQPHTLQLLFQKKWKGRIIADEHVLLSDVAHSKGKQFFFKNIGKLFGSRMAIRFSKIVAISEGVKLLLTQLVKIPDKKIELIPLGTDTDMYKPDAGLAKSFREKYDIPESALVVGYTGKIGEYKKVHYLIDAANEFNMQNLYVLLVGDVLENYKSLLNQKIADSNVPVIAIPSVSADDLPAVYNACDILAWPAHQTLSTVNASACGKPVICSDFLKERYDSGQGIGVVSGNYESFKKAFLTLAGNRELIAQMGMIGRRWALNEVSWNIINKRFIS